MSLFTDLTRGIIKENPTFRLVLGMCPTLAVTTSLENALGMGLAATFVLVCSNVVISSLRKLIPAAVRIPCYIVVIAAFVTMVDLLMQAYTYALWEKLGIFIPLIVVNCIILGRAEAFASKNGVLSSAADGVGMGIGFTIALAVIAALREFTGNGSVTVWGDLAFTAIHNRAMVLFILPAGGFLSLGLVLAFLNHLQAVSARRRGEAAPLPLELDCRHCALCKPVE
ncbi:MAG: electron transport complex subunit E [Kiritimatiellia bacterium]|jgi:electron transport complex protein RnfE|nr:electron transport complex subunit E [Kiritimatiellia bacterium]